jgi:hypothetical protein
MHYGVRSPNWRLGPWRVQAQSAHEAAEAGRDGVFLWDQMLLLASKRVPMTAWYRRR